MRIIQNKNIDSYKKLEKLSLFVFFSNLPNFIICLYAAFTASSIVVWVDAMVSLGETLHSFLVWWVAMKMVKETGDRFNFGLDRLEVFVSLVCDLIITIGMTGVLAGSILSLKNPSLPSDSLLVFCLLKVSNCCYDAFFYIKQSKICREHPSRLNETEKKAYWNSLLQDFIVGVIVLICYLFREQHFILYFQPIVSILLALWFVKENYLHIRDSIYEITDASIPLSDQDEVYDIVMADRAIIERIQSVNCRKLNDRTYIEISLKLKENASYGSIKDYLDTTRHKIQERIPNAEVLLVIGKEE